MVLLLATLYALAFRPYFRSRSSSWRVSNNGRRERGMASRSFLLVKDPELNRVGSCRL